MSKSSEQFLEQREFEMNQMISGVSWPITKKEIAKQADNALQRMLDSGDFDAFKVAETIKAMEEFIEYVRKDPRLIDFVRTEIAKYKGGRVDLTTGTILKAMESGIKYDYASCGDREWEEMNSQLEALKERMKEREAFLRTIPSAGLKILNEATGELETVYPPTKTSTSTYSVELKK